MFDISPVKRYRHLLTFWKQQREERRSEWQEAAREVDKWQDKLFAAEIAANLAAQDAEK